MVITESGKLVQVNASDVRPTARNTMGVIFARPDEDDRIIAITPNPERDIDDEDGESESQDSDSVGDETPTNSSNADESADNTVASEQESTQEGNDE